MAAEAEGHEARWASTTKVGATMPPDGEAFPLVNEAVDGLSLLELVWSLVMRLRNLLLLRVLTPSWAKATVRPNAQVQLQRMLGSGSRRSRTPVTTSRAATPSCRAITSARLSISRRGTRMSPRGRPSVPWPICRTPARSASNTNCSFWRTLSSSITSGWRERRRRGRCISAPCC